MLKFNADITNDMQLLASRLNDEVEYCMLYPPMSIKTMSLNHKKLSMRAGHHLTFPPWPMGWRVKSHHLRTTVRAQLC